MFIYKQIKFIFVRNILDRDLIDTDRKKQVVNWPLIDKQLSDWSNAVDQLEDTALVESFNWRGWMIVLYFRDWSSLPNVRWT